MKRIVILLAVIAALLMVPLIGMQFSDEVRWTLSDFAVAGLLLLATGLLIELVLRKTKKASYRNIAIALILLAFLLTWIELAVGIFGTPISGS
jgi:hypothetical protein